MADQKFSDLTVSQIFKYCRNAEYVSVSGKSVCRAADNQ